MRVRIARSRSRSASVVPRVLEWTEGVGDREEEMVGFLEKKLCGDGRRNVGVRVGVGVLTSARLPAS